MRPLETAYRLGTLQAERDFEAYLKEAAFGIPPGAPNPSSPSAVPKPATPNPAESLTLPNPAAQAQKQISNLGAAPGSNSGIKVPGTSTSGGAPQGAPG